MAPGHSEKKQGGGLLLLLGSAIWGFAFAAQSAGMEHITPFTFTTVRTLLACIALLPPIFILNRRRLKNGASPDRERETVLYSLKGGLVCGLPLCAATALQQYGILYSGAGKSGFITALYIVLVPVFGLFLKRVPPRKLWLCIFLAAAGFYLISVKGSLTAEKGDWLLLLCAACFAVQILFVDHFCAGGADSLILTAAEFSVVGLLTLPFTVFSDTPSFSAIWAARGSILYAGIMSGSVAYTLQAAGQKRTEPGKAALLMSPESVFAALGGWLFLNETLSLRELLGCALVFAAVLFCQLPVRRPDPLCPSENEP